MENINKENSNFDKAELKKKLTPLQYRVTQENGTEPPTIILNPRSLIK